MPNTPSPPAAKNVPERDFDPRAVMSDAFQCYASGSLEDAKRLLGEVLEHDPRNADAVHSLGVFALQSGALEDATAHLERAVRLDPSRAPFHNSLGVLHERLGAPEEAPPHFERASQLDPEYTVPQQNLGNLYKDLGLLDEAIACFERTLAVDPDHADARFNRSTALLSLERYTEGFEQYEARFRLGSHQRSSALRDLPRPLWKGGPLHGERVLLHGEQGLGDTLQFLRFAGRVRAAGGECLVAVQRPLTEIARRVDGIADVVSLDGPLPDFDLHAPLMSLPHVLGLHTVSSFDSGPYLTPDPALRAGWAGRLVGGSTPRIGLCWRASPIYGQKNHRRNRAPKSMVLSELAPLFAGDPGSFYSLQEALTDQEVSWLGDDGPVQTLGPDFDRAHGAFMDSAAVIDSLDLVITVDTAIAHLAGALGATVWLMLPYAPDWRWGTTGSASAWYPSMRIFRQTDRFDWSVVIDEVRAALDAGDWRNAPSRSNSAQEVR